MAHVVAAAAVTLVALGVPVGAVPPDSSPPPTTDAASTTPASAPAETPASGPVEEPVEAPVAKTIPGVPPTVPGEVPEMASIDQIVAAAQKIVGPSTDLPGLFAALVDVPEGIPTPAGAELVEFSLWLEPDDDPEMSHYRASLTFTSTATAADLVEFYETLMPAAGFPQTSNGTDSDQFGRRRELRFEQPDAQYWLSNVSVTVHEPADPDEPALHELVWYADADDSVLTPFLGWAPGLPWPPDAVPTEATFSRSSFLDIESITVEAVHHLPIDWATSKATFEQQLPVAGYALDANASGERTTELTGPGMNQITIYWSDASDEGTRATISARIVI